MAMPAEPPLPSASTLAVTSDRRGCATARPVESSREPFDDNLSWKRRDAASVRAAGSGPASCGEAASVGSMCSRWHATSDGNSAARHGSGPASEAASQPPGAAATAAAAILGSGAFTQLNSPRPRRQQRRRPPAGQLRRSESLVEEAQELAMGSGDQVLHTRKLSEPLSSSSSLQPQPQSQEQFHLQRHSQQQQEQEEPLVPRRRDHSPTKGLVIAHATACGLSAEVASQAGHEASHGSPGVLTPCFNFPMLQGDYDPVGVATSSTVQIESVRACATAEAALVGPTREMEADAGSVDVYDVEPAAEPASSSPFNNLAHCVAAALPPTPPPPAARIAPHLRRSAPQLPRMFSLQRSMQPDDAPSGELPAATLRANSASGQAPGVPPHPRHSMRCAQPTRLSPFAELRAGAPPGAVASVPSVIALRSRSSTSTKSQLLSSGSLHRAAVTASAAAAAAATADVPLRCQPHADLLLRVDSCMSLGSWSSRGAWSKHTGSADRAAAAAAAATPLPLPPGVPEIRADDLARVRELGRGHFGSVYLASWRGAPVAVKELLVGSPTDNGMRTGGAPCVTRTLPRLRDGDGGGPGGSGSPLDEAALLASLRHPNIVGLYGVVTDPGCAALVLEYMPSGSLREGLWSLDAAGLCSRSVRAALALQAARGMDFLHARNTLHLDLKADNLLCDIRDINAPIVKIGDLGLSKGASDGGAGGDAGGPDVGMAGTLPFMAPEMFTHGSSGGGGGLEQPPQQQLTDKVDVYSFGVCLWEIWVACKERPYRGMPAGEVLAGVLTGTLRPLVPDGCDPQWADLMCDCWASDPRSRPSFGEICGRLECMLQEWNTADGGAAACLLFGGI